MGAREEPYGSDTLGRIPQLESFQGYNPLSGGGESDWENGGKCGVHHSVNNTTHLDNTLRIQATLDVMQVVMEDLIYQRILKEVGSRSKLGLRELPRDHPAQRLKQVWDSLGRCRLLDGNEMIMVDSTRLFIPEAARPEVLEHLHVAHLGVTKMYQSGKSMFYWPNMWRDIERVVQQCEACQRFSPSRPRKELLQHGDFPVRPMESLCFYMFHYRSGHALHLMDNFSGYVWMMKFAATPSTEQVTKALEGIFNVAGFLECLFSDSGLQMKRLFDIWCVDMGIEHSVSSAYFASSNGAIERSLKSLKILMKKHDLERRGKLEEAVDILNSAPVTAEGMSASRLFYGHPIRKPGLTMLLADNVEESATAKWKVEDREWRKQNRNGSMSRL